MKAWKAESKGRREVGGRKTLLIVRVGIGQAALDSHRSSVV